MNLKKLSEPFPVEEIEWRISQCGVNNKGTWARCLAYINARAVMNRLDEVCGPGNWTVEYRALPADDRFEPGFIGRLGIRIDGEWVFKEDGAEQTDFEPFKGGISGAFKRVACAWGIGRYLYNLEAGFADTLATKTPGYELAKTKDGKEFYWRPPALPSWALPSKGGSPNPQPTAPVARSAPPPALKTAGKKSASAPIQAKGPAPEPSPSKVALTRTQLNKEIMATAAKLRLDQKAIVEWVDDVFKKTADKLSLEEQQKFLEILQAELGGISE